MGSFTNSRRYFHQHAVHRTAACPGQGELELHPVVSHDWFRLIRSLLLLLFLQFELPISLVSIFPDEPPDNLKCKAVLTILVPAVLIPRTCTVPKIIHSAQCD